MWRTKAGIQLTDLKAPNLGFQPCKTDTDIKLIPNEMESSIWMNILPKDGLYAKSNPEPFDSVWALSRNLY